MASIDSQQLEQHLHAATDPHEQIDLLNALTSHVRFVNLDLAWHYNAQALELCHGLHEPYVQGLADCYYWKGKLFAIQQKYHDALEALYQALDMCKVIQSDQQHTHLQNKSKLYPDGPDQFLEAGATSPVLHNIIGIILTYLEQYDKALEHYLSAWRLAESMHNQWIMVLLCNNIGFMYREMDLALEAQPYLQQGRYLVEDIPYSQAQQRLKATILDNSCWVATQLGNIEQALEHATMSFAIYQELGWILGQAEILNCLGYTYQTQASYDQALITFTQAYEYAKQIQAYQEMMYACLQQARILIHLNRFLDAIKQIRMVLRLSAFSHQQTCESYLLLAQIFEHHKKYRPALKYYKLFHTLHEQLFTNKSDQRFKVLQTIHRVEQTQAQAQRYYLISKTLQQELEQHKQVQADLQYQAQTDPLTGSYNRRYFFEYAQREWEKAVRYQRPLSVLIMDLDFFKLVNDTYGHGVGDQILFQFADLIQAHIRSIDVFGRYGGEEFTLLLPETNLDEAALIAERLRNLVANHQFKIEQLNIHITMSIGAAEKIPPQDEAFEDMLQRADDALLKAKKFGRNQTHGPGYKSFQ